MGSRKDALRCQALSAAPSPPQPRPFSLLREKGVRFLSSGGFVRFRKWRPEDHSSCRMVQAAISEIEVSGSHSSEQMQEFNPGRANAWPR